MSYTKNEIALETLTQIQQPFLFVGEEDDLSSPFV